VCRLRLSHARPAHRQASANQLALSADEDRHALALAHYATGVSLAATDGPLAALPEYQLAFDLDPHNTALAMWLARCTGRDAT